MELIHCWGHNPLCTMKAELIHWVNTFSVTYTLSSFSLTPNRFTSKSWKENQLFFFFFFFFKATDLGWNAFGLSIQGISWTDSISFLLASHSSSFILVHYNDREQKSISPSIACSFLLPDSLKRHMLEKRGKACVKPTQKFEALSITESSALSSPKGSRWGTWHGGRVKVHEPHESSPLMPAVQCVWGEGSWRPTRVSNPLTHRITITRWGMAKAHGTK